MYKTVGIIGGMGPAAACDLMDKIIKKTDAKDDQHHVHVFLDNNTNIPDRTEAILHGGADPVPELVKSAQRLQSIGADVLMMSCHTVHYFYDAVQPHLEIPMLHMPRETAKYLSSLGIEKVGVLATDGTVQSGVYEKALASYGIEAVYPDEEGQQLIMSLVYDYIKKGITDRDDLPEREVRAVREEMRQEGVEYFIMACTELPIAFHQMQISDGMIDPTEVLAEAAIDFVGAPKKVL